MEKNAVLSERFARFYFKQLFDAVNHLHNVKNIAHRDIKPLNVLITSRDGDNFLKLADFGHCIDLSNKPSGFVTTEERGTRGYRPLEV